MIPPLRGVIFPALVEKVDSDASSQNSTAPGQPESLDSLTGAPENHKGEAAEQEAKNLIDSFATVAMESAAAKYGQTVVPEPTDQPLIGDGLNIEENPETPAGDAPEDKTKKPMKEKVSHGTDKLMRGLSDITDIYEQFAKYETVSLPEVAC